LKKKPNKRKSELLRKNWRRREKKRKMQKRKMMPVKWITSLQLERAKIDQLQMLAKNQLEMDL